MNALLPRLVNGATFLFFALSLAVKSGYSYGVALLLLAALITLPHWWPRRPHDAALRWLAFGFFFAGSVALLDVIRSGIGARGLEAPLKFFAVPLLLYFLATVPPKGRAIWAGAACGALLGLASAWYYSHFAPELLPAGRAARYLHPIQLGNIGKLHLIHPTLRFRGRIKQIWLIDQRLIDLNHLTGHRTFHLAGGLHRLNHRGLIADSQLTANLRQLDKNNIAQRILGKIRNPDSANRTLDTNPLMIISKLQHKNTS